jgi:hypothetical protein
MMQCYIDYIMLILYYGVRIRGENSLSNINQQQTNQTTNTQNQKPLCTFNVPSTRAATKELCLNC